MPARPFRPPAAAALLCLLLAAAHGPAAAGQDLGDILDRLGDLRELRDRLRDRDRDRDPEPPPTGYDREVVPVDPRYAPPGLYGGAAGPAYGDRRRDRPDRGYDASGRYGRDFDGGRFRSGPSFENPSPYGPASPFDGRGADDFVRGSGEWVMRSGGVRPGRYRVTEVPGGPVTVRVLPDDGRPFGRGAGNDRGRDPFGRDPLGGAGPDPAVAAQAREANRQAAEIGRVAAAVADPLRDVRYGLRFAADQNRGGRGGRGDFASDLAEKAERAERLRAALVTAARPARRTADGEVRGGDDFDRLGEAAKAFDGTLHDLAEPIDRRVRDPWLRGKAAELERLDGELHAAYAAMGAARQAIRDLQRNDRNDDRGRGAGGTERVKLFALAARLTENTDDLRRAVDAADGFGGAGGTGGRGFGDRDPWGYGTAYRGGAPAAGSALTRLTERLHADAVALRRSLAEAAADAEVAAADDAFERTWRDWQAAAVGRFPADHPVRAAGRAVDAVDRRLVTGVRGAARPGRGGRSGAAAVGLNRAAAAFARELPRFNLADDREFVRAVDRLAAAADYYADVARTAAPGEGAEPRARDALERAFEPLADPLTTLADRPRGNDAGDLAREILEARDDWRDRPR